MLHMVRAQRLRTNHCLTINVTVVPPNIAPKPSKGMVVNRRNSASAKAVMNLATKISTPLKSAIIRSPSVLFRRSSAIRGPAMAGTTKNTIAT